MIGADFLQTNAICDSNSVQLHQPLKSHFCDAPSLRVGMWIRCCPAVHSMLRLVCKWRHFHHWLINLLWARCNHSVVTKWCSSRKMYPNMSLKPVLQKILTFIWNGSFWKCFLDTIWTWPCCWWWGTVCVCVYVCVCLTLQMTCLSRRKKNCRKRQMHPGDLHHTWSNLLCTVSGAVMRRYSCWFRCYINCLYVCLLNFLPYST